jgi:ubiquinone/menaquinone biosynthesis C-methylase UbiE
MTTPDDRQRRVDAHFDSHASEWHEVYGADGFGGVLYRERSAAVLARIDSIPRRDGRRALDVGCGAGFMTVELAQRGYSVDAIDSSEQMIKLTARHVDDEGLADAVTVGMADVHALPFASGTFDLVVSLGVLPWIAHPAQAVAEFARVVAPGGDVLFTADNRARLNLIVDVRRSPFLLRARQAKRALLSRERPANATPYRFHWPSTVDAMVRDAGLERVDAHSTGFGQFTLFGHRLLDDAGDVRMHHRLQALADRGVPGLRGTGAHYIVHARRPPAPEAA